MQGWNMYSNQYIFFSLLICVVKPLLNHLGKQKFASFLLLMYKGVPGARIRVAMDLEVVLWICGEGVKETSFSALLFSKLGIQQICGIRYCTTGHHFPVRRIPSLLANHQTLQAQPSTFDPTTQLRAQSALGSFHLSWVSF